MRPPLLDTHAWIWYLGDQTKLTWTELNALDALDFENRPFISDFSLWEIATLISIKRLTLDRPLDRWLSIAARPTSVRILAVSVSVAIELAELPDAFHRDPADRAIVATARAHGLPVLTRDRKIIDSRLVEIWAPE
ncbi:MAG: type II toxin-antitoxin system VapC family toxin [Terrimicrobiaceae bacterium]